jgi:AcrR family transcriptional regulator
MVWDLTGTEPVDLQPGAAASGQPGAAASGQPGAGTNGQPGAVVSAAIGANGQPGAAVNGAIGTNGQPAHRDHPWHPGDHTRERILHVALELIADRGYAATSTREIAERLGFTKAALYYHFRSKDELLAAIVGPPMAELEALIERARADDGQRARRSLIVGYVELVSRHAELIRILASDPSVKESAGLHVATPIFRRLVPLLAGTDEPDTAQRTRVRAALSAVHGALVHAQPDDDPEILRTTAVEVACAALGLPAPKARKKGS